MKFRITRADILVVVASFMLTYVACEAGYRVYLYRSLYAQIWKQVAAQISPTPDPASNYQFDINVGYRYQANRTETRGHPFFSTFHLNSHGHVSHEEYPVAKPAGEYRIAVLGDSFAATINNNVNWTELVEAQLNASKAWRSHVGGKTTRLINFGVDGQGFQHFEKVAQYRVPLYQPDLVIISFITDDFRRRFFYAGSIPIPPGQTREQVIDRQAHSTLDALPWFSPRPEIALGVIGPKLGLEGRLPVRATLAHFVTVSRYLPRSDAIAAGVNASLAIRRFSPNTLFLVHPQCGELVGSPFPEMAGLLEGVARSGPGLSFVDMSHYLDLPGSEAELRRWFFLPDDLHYNDHGVRMYADAVSRFLTADYLEKGATTARGALVSAATIGKSWTGFRTVPHGAAASPASNAADSKDLRLLQSTTKIGPNDVPIERREAIYATYVGFENSVDANAPLPKTAAGLLGASLPLPDGAERVRIRASVPLVAQRGTPVVAGIFIGEDAMVAAVQRRVEAAAGARTVIEIDQIYDVRGQISVFGAMLRIGVGSNAKVFPNGTDQGPNAEIGNPVMVIEVY